MFRWENLLNKANTLALGARRRTALRTVVQTVGVVALAMLVSLSAIVIKHARTQTGLHALAEVEAAGPSIMLPPSIAAESLTIHDPLAIAAPDTAISDLAVEDAEPTAKYPPDTRWFDGRPVRPSGTMWMTVTAYSPDERSCGDSADGITSSLHSVWTNGMKLVAADSRILPLGSMITVPGYDDGNIVPVLDRGGAIKGHRLDVLYPTHEQARKWGVQRIKVVVWEYADGKPAGNWRRTRDSK